MKLFGLFSKSSSSMQMDKRAILLEKIIRAGFPEKEVFVGIDDFFNGNQDESSIGGNIYTDPPSLQAFYTVLTQIKNDPRTEDLLIRITDVNDCEWFYTDTVYVFGDYTLSQIQELFKPLQPDEIYEGLVYVKRSNIPLKKSGSREFSIWWD